MKNCSSSWRASPSGREAGAPELRTSLPGVLSRMKSAHGTAEGVSAAILIHVSGIDRLLALRSSLARRFAELIFITPIRIHRPATGGGSEAVEEAILILFLSVLDPRGVNPVREIQNRTGVGFRKTGRPSRTFLPERPAGK